MQKVKSTCQEQFFKYNTYIQHIKQMILASTFSAFSHSQRRKQELHCGYSQFIAILTSMWLHPIEMVVALTVLVHHYLELLFSASSLHLEKHIKFRRIILYLLIDKYNIHQFMFILLFVFEYETSRDGKPMAMALLCISALKKTKEDRSFPRKQRIKYHQTTIILNGCVYQAHLIEIKRKQDQHNNSNPAHISQRLTGCY